MLLGDGVVAGVLLNKSKTQNSGWMVITMGWALAVAIPVYAVGRIRGAHINPARDLAPHLAHAILPISGKGGSDGGSSWVPILDPVLGGIAGAVAYAKLFGA